MATNPNAYVRSWLRLLIAFKFLTRKFSKLYACFLKRKYSSIRQAGKTVTAVSDAKLCGERTLFLAHTRELVAQAKSTFENTWHGKQIGMYVAEQKDMDAYVVCGSIQSVAQNIEQFRPDDFGYLIIDEAVILGLN